MPGLEHDDVMEALLRSGHLPVSSITDLRLVARSLKETVRRKMPHDVLYRLGYGCSKTQPVSCVSFCTHTHTCLCVSEGQGAQVLDVAALKQAFGGVAIRRVKTNIHYVSALHLLPCLESLALVPCFPCVASEPLDVSPLAGLTLRQLSIKGYGVQDNRVRGLAQLSSSSSLRLDSALPGNFELPKNLTDFTMVGYDLWSQAVVDPQADQWVYERTLKTLRSFNGHLQSLALRPCRIGDSSLPDKLATLTSLPCLQRLTDLNIVLRAESWADDAVLASLTQLQSVTILISGADVSRCSFAAWPKLQKLDLTCILHASSTCWDLTRIIGMRTRYLELSISDRSSDVRMLTDFAGWGLEAASITMTDETGELVPCKSSQLGRDLLGALWCELPQEVVNVDKAV